MDARLARWICSTFLVGVLFPSQPLMCQTTIKDCLSPVTPGNRDLLLISNERDYRLARDYWQCTNEFHSHEEAHNFGFSWGSLVYGKELKFGSNFTDSQRDTWKKTHCEQDKLRLSESQQNIVYQLKQNPGVIRLAERCLELSSTSLRLDLQQVDDCSFTLALSHHSPNPQNERLRLTAPPSIAGAQCAGLPSTSAAARNQDLTAGAIWNCRRTARNAVVATFNTNYGSASRSLAPLPEKPPPPPGAVYEDRWFDTSSTGQLLSASCSVTAAIDYKKPECWGGQAPPLGLAGLGPACGTCSSPAATKIYDVRYGCSGPGCGWSFHRRPESGYAPDLENLSDNQIRWYRRWTGDPTFETYTLFYREQRRTCVTNCDHDAQYEAWLKAKGATCPPN